MDNTVPSLRVRAANELPIQGSRKCVLYWMTAFRRTRYNFALQHACHWARELGRPLVILEALRVRYRWACDRFHRFVIHGMQDNARACQGKAVLYYPYVESGPGAGAGLLQELAKQACLIVSDDYPCFFHPKMFRAVAGKLPAKLLLVDSNGLMPLAAADRTFSVAHSYRRWMQKVLPAHLHEMPRKDPLPPRSSGQLPFMEELPGDIAKRWRQADFEELLEGRGLAGIPIDHSIPDGVVAGGAREAGRLLRQFIEQRLKGYDADRNEPDERGSSELSPHLHFGHLSSHEVFRRVMDREDWNPGKLKPANGKRSGFWGVGGDAEAFLDQLCTWRELGFNMCWREEGYDRLDSLPAWAQQTLDEHAQDKREHAYGLSQFERAQTHDEIWNAAQRQLVREGRIHNYLRMLWGKKILHWTRSPQDALDIMIELNNKYALDGRDPNSYSGIFWVLGRYDRAWGPERPIFGKVRYMTSGSAAKKHRLKEYLQRYAEW